MINAVLAPGSSYSLLAKRSFKIYLQKSLKFLEQSVT